MISLSTVTFSGIDVVDVEVQVHFAKGQPGLTIVGLGDKAITESKDRIKAVLSSIGISLPPSKITINLAPADLLKEGTHFDLPIALGILCGLDIINKNILKRYIIMGELSLDGSVRGINGVLPASMHAMITERGMVCPKDNGSEAIWAGEDLDVIAVDNILSLINYFKGNLKIERPIHSEDAFIKSENIDISDVLGQENAKKALLIAAAGGHNMLMIGQPGTGKSMLATRIKTILPDLNPEEMLEVSMIHSIAGLIKNGKLSFARPFRSPHHSASLASILGGGRNIKPGEITLAHNGILFLDEFAEYPRVLIDSLRQPIEAKEINITRVNARITYPAKFQLIAAMNPCHCGYAGMKNKECNKIPNCVINYQRKISGPIIDRIDIQVKMDIQKYDINSYENKKNDVMNSSKMKAVVVKTREIQAERYKNHSFKLNSEASEDAIREFCLPKDQESRDILNQASEKFNLSMRSISKILKVARTIADIREKQEVDKTSIIEAIKYKINDFN